MNFGDFTLYGFCSGEGPSSEGGVGVRPVCGGRWLLGMPAGDLEAPGTSGCLPEASKQDCSLRRQVCTNTGSVVDLFEEKTIYIDKFFRGCFMAVETCTI